MKKSNFLSGIAIGIGLGACMLTGGLSSQPNLSTNFDITPDYLTSSTGIHTTTTYSYTNTLKADPLSVTIQNDKFRLALNKLLGKSSSNTTFYSNDITTHNDFKTREEPSESGPNIMVMVANKNCLDFSSSNLDDITELVKFEIPSTILAINLSDNNFDKTKLLALNNLLNTPVGFTLTYGDSTITTSADFSNIAKVNLGFNKIDLQSLDSGLISNNKYLYGIQILNPITESIVTPDELNIQYYIRDIDLSYLTYKITKNNTPIHTYNIRTSIDFNTSLGSIGLEIASIPASASAYFVGYSKALSFLCVKPSLNITKPVERKSILMIFPSIETTHQDSSGNIIVGEVEIGGLPNYQYTIGNCDTNTTGTHYVAVSIKTNSLSRTFSLLYTVVDTIAPTITLNKPTTFYLSQNKAFEEPGYTALDQGDNISDRSHVIIEGLDTLDITKLGTYLIKYTAKDDSNNYSEPVFRTVIIKERVLDTINLRCTTEKTIAGADTLLVVEPDIEISNYQDFVYKWYMDDSTIPFITTQGDNITGKSSTIIQEPNACFRKIYVELEAKTKDTEPVDIFVRSNDLNLEFTLELNQNQTLLIALAVAVSIITITIIAAGIIRSRRSKRSTSKKSNKSKGNSSGGKKSSKNSNSNAQDIQIIKDYDPNNPNNPDTNNLFK